MGNYIEIPLSPVAFTIGPITVGWYGIMVALAVVTLVIWALVTVKKDPILTSDVVMSAAIVGILSGIIGARLLHVIDLWQYYCENPGLIIGGSGLTIWGAVLGAALGIWIYSRFRKISFGHFADVIAPGIILAQAVGRIGCTILGDDYGFATSLPWGFIYTSPLSPANMAVGLTPTHPVVVYEIIYNLIVCGILIMLKKKLRPDGSIFLIYLTLYSVWRLGGDFLREGTPFLFGMHQAQIISIIVMIISVALLIWRTRWKKEENEPSTVHSDENPLS